MSDKLLIELNNDLLNWREHAHEVLGDYLEEHGLERRFHDQGGLHSRIGVVRALLHIDAITPTCVRDLDLPREEQRAAVDRYNDAL
jgi:hypothetical protein